MHSIFCCLVKDKLLNERLECLWPDSASLSPFENGHYEDSSRCLRVLQDASFTTMTENNIPTYHKTSHDTYHQPGDDRLPLWTDKYRGYRSDLERCQKLAHTRTLKKIKLAQDNKSSIHLTANDPKGVDTLSRPGNLCHS